MEKLDLTKHYKAYYTASTSPTVVHIPAAQYLSIQGKGDPSSAQYAAVLEALYTTAYALKFMYKAQQQDFVVAKLEGLWWFDETRFANISMANAPQQIPRSEWHYRMLIRLPDFVTPTAVKNTVEKIVSTKQIALVKAIELYQMEEGKCVQILHVGPFENEPESLKQIQHFVEINKLEKNGLHHEIYLSDFRKTAPEKLRTILREPVK